MIKEGQIYREKNKPNWRKHDKDVFVISYIGYYIHTIDTSGITCDISTQNWIEGNCELIAEYPTWQEAVNSKEFK